MSAHVALRGVLRVSPVVRLTVGLMALVFGMLLALNLVFDVVPDRERTKQESQRRFAENLAVQIASLAATGNEKSLGSALQSVLTRNPEVLSVALREASGYIVDQRGDHGRYWAAPETGRPSNHLRLPLQANGKHWGDVEIAFAPDSPQGIREWLTEPTALSLLAFVIGGVLLIYCYLRRTLHYLDPSATIPDRVRKAFDAFSDGVVVLAPDGRIVLANNSFRNLLAEGRDDLHGRLLAELPWPQTATAHNGNTPRPWDAVLRDGNPVKGYALSIAPPHGDPIEMTVACTPIADTDGRLRGCLVTFDDVTEIHRTNAQLRHTLVELEQSREKIEAKNEELRLLATRDPMTGCLNRRAFFEIAGNSFDKGLRTNREVSCIMADIDHFKSFNDVYGHSVGDQVIQVVARTMSSKTRTEDALCRYGGEEFCILLPDTDLEHAQETAERMRSAIEAHAVDAIRSIRVQPITASFGVASLRQGAVRIEELIDQADNALYVSKESGRNRVTAWQPPAPPEA
ncbi:MAG: hypothetical protein A2045_04060 [Rhodocyclales bacterium GWA2_65_20]|nr:MAG: hypothetical protein A2045_04060 [Rhodocyclales bacterium GWA2_65_20]